MKLYRDFTSQEEIDREYNVDASVPDFPRYVAFFVGESERARRDLPHVADVRYGPTRDEVMDVFPAARPGAPLLVFIHGGYWRILSAKEFSLVARGLVARGVTVAVTNYSLCPKVPLSEITRQSRAAIAFLQREAARFNADPERIVVAGHSAGGQQVGMLLATDWPGEYDLPATVLKGGIAISGLFDLGPFPYSWLQPKLQLDHRMVAQESPLFHIPRRAPPLMVTLGGDESAEFHRQSATYLEAWRAAGLEGEHLAQPGKNHFTAIDGYLDPDSLLTESTLRFIERTTTRGTARTEPAADAAPRFPTFGAGHRPLSFEQARRS